MGRPAFNGPECVEEVLNASILMLQSLVKCKRERIIIYCY
jgi:hypothetical protein